MLGFLSRSTIIINLQNNKLILKISIITVCFNSDKTIEKTILSVLSQTYNNIEYIIIDGKSMDNTVSIIQGYIKKIAKFISEPDKGIYDALNKGIAYATGDVIGILHSDDMFFDSNVLKNIANAFDEDGDLEATIGDIVFVNKTILNQVIRVYSSKKWNPGKFAWGYMPAHPSFFCRKKVYQRLGDYKLNYKIASDYELLIRYLLIQKIRYKYLPIITTKMRLGGVSTSGFKSLLLLNREIKQACTSNGINTNYIMIYFKYFFKIFEFLVIRKEYFRVK